MTDSGISSLILSKLHVLVLLIQDQELLSLRPQSPTGMIFLNRSNVVRDPLAVRLDLVPIEAALLEPREAQHLQRARVVLRLDIVPHHVDKLIIYVLVFPHPLGEPPAVDEVELQILHRVEHRHDRAHQTPVQRTVAFEQHIAHARHRRARRRWHHVCEGPVPVARVGPALRERRCEEECGVRKEEAQAFMMEELADAQDGEVADCVVAVVGVVDLGWIMGFVLEA